jgi:Amt family ammonium transporter
MSSPGANCTDVAVLFELLSNQSVAIQSLQSQLSAANYDFAISDLQVAVNFGWLLTCSYLVFIMQLGFALLEAGSVRAMNTKNILMQNILDTCISIIAFWVVGWGIFSGHLNGFIGDFTQSAVLDEKQFAKFIFIWAFNNAATTIVSGAVTSRIKFGAYMASCVLISGFTFPVVAYWLWGNGVFSAFNPLNTYKVIDFAGGLVVHSVGGVSGLVGSAIVGPRTGRWVKDADGKWIDNRESGHSIVLATIG